MMEKVVCVCVVQRFMVLTRGHFEVNAVAVVGVAAVDVEQALCTEAEEWLPRRYEPIPSDASTDVLLLVFNE